MEGSGGSAGEGACSVADPRSVRLAPGPSLPLVVSAAITLAFLALHGAYWALVALSIVAAVVALEVAEAIQALGSIYKSRLRRCAQGSVETIYASVLIEAPGLKGPLELSEEKWSRQIEHPPIIVFEGSEVFSGRYTIKAAPGLSESRSSRIIWHSSFALLAVEAVYNVDLRVPVKPAPLVERAIVAEIGVEAARSRLGGGFEVEVVREWEPWDDARRINWSASARSGKLMVWEGPPDAGVRLHLFIDLSRPAWSGSPGSTRADRAMRLAAGLAGVAAGLGGVLGYTVYTGGGWVTRHPGPAREVYASLVEMLSWTRPEDSASPGLQAFRALREALGAARAAGARLAVIASSPSICDYIKEAGFERVVVEGCGSTRR